MKKIARSVSKLVSFKLDMLDQIETYMEIHNTNFSESVRQIIRAFFDTNQNVSTVSINDSEPNDIVDDVVKEALKDTPKDTEQPPTDNTPKTNNNDFNWDGIKL